jgi:uncharacterized protein YfiM (DUF2279 family)
MKLWLKCLILVGLFANNGHISAQNNDTILPTKPSPYLIPALGLAYTTGMIALYHAWYKNYDSGSFRFFNDNKEWLQIDKLGHLTTSWYLGMVGYESFRLAGHSENTSLWLGGSAGSIFLTGIEILDGFSDGWGFSWGDALANFSGSALFIAQQKHWKEQRIMLKYSYTHSPYAAYRPELLGKSGISRALKDYNGQRYWLSFNLASFLHNSERFPGILNLAIGYGASGMLGGHDNIWEKDGIQFDFSNIPRERLFYLSLDLDLTKIKTNKKWLKYLFTTVGFIKFPAPALEFNLNKDFRFRPLMF